jgi:hypothetical protein
VASVAVKSMSSILRKKIISFSLWGDNPIYWIGALKNINLASKYYPDWICRFYIDKNSRQNLIENIKGDNVETIIVDSPHGSDVRYNHHGMFWRFNSSIEEDVDFFLSRDCDSRISEREVDAVNEWINSDKDFHIMRDHPAHVVPILGGMWGCKNGIMREIGLLEKINNWLSNKKENYKQGIDQEFLRDKIYNLIKDRAMEHSEFNLRFGGEIRPFPTKRVNYEFVGDVFDENDVRHPDYWKLIKKI